MRLFAIILCLALAACAAVTAPPGSGNVTPHIEDGFLVARDGMKLPLREWKAGGDAPKAVIIALHGMSDYSNAFDMPAKVWAKLGITTRSAMMIVQPVIQPGMGPSARVAHVNVVPQSGSARFR